MSQTSYKEWLEISIYGGAIYCPPENYIKLDSIHIDHEALGVVYKATVKQKNGNIVKNVLGRKFNISLDTTVAVKILITGKHGDYEERLRQLQFVKEVPYYHPLCLPQFLYVT